jgi:hypothetical protein
MHLRNDSFDPITGITHVYLYSPEESHLVPCDYETRHDSSLQSTFRFQSITGAVPQATTSPRTEAVPLRSFTANPIDAPDGLTKQFRLKLTFPGLPPGAVEEGRINFMFVKGSNEADHPFRLRLHSPSQYHDFVFRLLIKRITPAPEKPASSEKLA